ncbi:hypothetical protein BVC80_1413g10 [Macleaya cordata]|uniref:Uncharacterized protein n=1 Tax=Macleaya cordata TaxID=56857 RepID=A0A200R7Y2_MACCD|nr:hypothetical protein BVC80_1413g10 [Macleaya cordata]
MSSGSGLRGLRKKPFPHYESLCDIFLQDRANGKDAGTPADEEEEIEADANDNFNLDGDGLNGLDGFFDGDNDTDATLTNEHTPSHANSTTRVTESGKKKRRRQSDGFVSSMGNIAGAFNKFVDGTMGLMDKMATALTYNQENETATRVVEELTKLDALNVHQMLNAANIINSDSSKSALFLALKPEIRLFWVYKLLNHEG